jgi:SAM-dependent methyltransferase
MVAMTRETYTPGHGPHAVAFMARRSLATHGAFFLPHLRPGLTVLDCGCGPGTITVGLAEMVAPGKVVGIDASTGQVEAAAARASAAGLANVTFQVANCYHLPFAEGTFDLAFSHALLEHLGDPVAMLREVLRVLKPGGVAGVCSPDWGGFLLAPPAEALQAAIEEYKTIQRRNGGDVEVGRKLGLHLAGAGLRDVRVSARYECYPSLDFIGGFLASQLDGEGRGEAAAVVRRWVGSEGGMFAQAWVSATGRKP